MWCTKPQASASAVRRSRRPTDRWIHETAGVLYCVHSTGTCSSPAAGWPWVLLL